MHDVLYVPGLAQDLLSVGQLMQRGFKLIFDENECLILDKGKKQVVTKVQMTPNKIFPIILPLITKNALRVKHDDSLLWHLRYGHLNYKSLKVFKNKNMVIGLPIINIEKQVCE